MPMDVALRPVKGVSGRRPRAAFRIQDLPQELHDKIFDEFVKSTAYVFEFNRGGRRYVRVPHRGVIRTDSTDKMCLKQHDQYRNAISASTSFRDAILAAMGRLQNSNYEFEHEVTLMTNKITDAHLLTNFPRMRNVTRLAIKMIHCDELSHFNIFSVASAIQDLLESLTNIREFTLQIMSSQAYVWWGLLQIVHEWTSHDPAIRTIESIYSIPPSSVPARLQRFAIAVKHRYLVHRTKIVHAVTGQDQWIATRTEVDPHTIEKAGRRQYTSIQFPGSGSSEDEA